MPTSTAILKSRLYSILPEVQAELEEILERILIVRVNGHPLRALGTGVDGVEADGDFAFEVAADDVWRQAVSLAGFVILGPVIVMLAGFRVRAVRLKRVRPAIHKDAKIISYDIG